MPSTFTIATPAPRRKGEPPGGNGRNQVYLLVKTGGGSGPGLDGPGIGRLEAGLPLTEIAAHLEDRERADGSRVYLLVAVKGSAPPVAPAAKPAAAKPARPAGGLTARQHEILTALGKGASNKKIAYSLGIVEGTVKGQLKAIYRQLGVKNRTQAAMLALRRDG